MVNSPLPAALRGPSSQSSKGFSDTWTPQRSASRPSPARVCRPRCSGAWEAEAGASPTRLPAVVPASFGFPAPSPGAAGPSTLGRTSHGPGLSGRHARGSPDLRLSYKSAPRGNGLPLCSTPTTPGPQEQVPAGPSPLSRPGASPPGRSTAHVLGEHAPYSQVTLHDGPTQLSGPRIMTDPRAGRVTRGPLRKPRPHVAASVDSRPRGDAWALPNCETRTRPGQLCHLRSEDPSQTLFCRHSIHLLSFSALLRFRPSPTVFLFNEFCTLKTRYYSNNFIRGSHEPEVRRAPPFLLT